MNYTWYKIEGVTVSSFEDETMREAMAGEKKIGLLKSHQRIYAFASSCPHAGAPICQGWLDARGRIVCPVHGYRFDPANGHNTSGEGYKLRTFKVDIKENHIYVGLIEE